jgi:hypothetical protein
MVRDQLTPSLTAAGLMEMLQPPRWRRKITRVHQLEEIYKRIAVKTYAVAEHKPSHAASHATPARHSYFKLR